MGVHKRAKNVRELNPVRPDRRTLMMEVHYKMALHAHFLELWASAEDCNTAASHSHLPRCRPILFLKQRLMPGVLFALQLARVLLVTKKKEKSKCLGQGLPQAWDSKGFQKNLQKNFLSSETSEFSA